MKYIVILTALASPYFAHAQTGSIGVNTSTPHSSAAIDITSSTKGLLLPRMTTAQMQSIANPAEGLLIYNTTEKAFYGYRGGNGTDIIYQYYAEAYSGFVNTFGQSFSAPNSTPLTGIGIYGVALVNQSNQYQSGPFLLTIEVYSGAGFSGTKLGTVTKNFIFPSAAYPEADLSFDVSSLRIQLLPSQQYSFKVIPPASLKLQYAYADGNGYSGLYQNDQVVPGAGLTCGVSTGHFAGWAPLHLD